MSDLVAFLNARLDEDEATLKHAALDAPHFPDCDTMVKDADYPNGPCDCGLPERWRREVEAKRHIIDCHRQVEGIPDRCSEDEVTWPCPTLRVLAAVWSDHPDYDPAWA